MSEIFSELRRAYETALQNYGSNPAVTGIDIGYKYVKGKRQKELAVRFLVDEKLPLGAIPAEEVLPAHIEVPSRRVLTDVPTAPHDFTRGGVESEHRKERLNPIRPGISVSHGARGAGTLGALVYLKESGAPAILSCWHVLAAEHGRRGDPIYQPSLVDGGDPRFDVIGHLERWFVDEDGDAAVAVLTGARMRDADPLDLDLDLIGARPVRLGEVLEKSGRATGSTRALVDGIGRYRLRLHSGEPVWVEGFRLVPLGGEKNEISSMGDSGSVWISRESTGGVGVGLHIDGEKGPDEPEHAIACHLPRVLERLGVSLTPRVDKEPDLSVDQVLEWIRRNRGSLQGLVNLHFPENGAEGHV